MDVTKLTPEQTRSILDFVLGNSYHPRDYWDFKEDLLKHHDYFPNGDEYLLKMALNKLKQDGYIDFISINGTQQKFVSDYSVGENMTIRRNFNGHTFLSDGGYKGEEEKRITNESSSAAYDCRMETYSERLAVWTTRLTYATWLAGGSAALLFLWEIRHWVASLFS
jgi:hypothetical protein